MGCIGEARGAEVERESREQNTMADGGCACRAKGGEKERRGTTAEERRGGYDVHGTHSSSLTHNKQHGRLTMSHHLFLLSPSDTPIYNLTHYSNKPAQTTSYPLSSNLPSWSTSAFAGTLTALSGASSATQSHHVQGGGGRMGGGQDRHVIQMIANASLDVVEDVMRKENAM